MNYEALKAFPPSTPCKFKQIKKKAEQVETKKPFHQAPVANSKKKKKSRTGRNEIFKK